MELPSYEAFSVSSSPTLFESWMLVFLKRISPDSRSCFMIFHLLGQSADCFVLLFAAITFL